MKIVNLVNRLQDICHSGHSLKDIKLVINDVEISVSDVEIYAEKELIKLVINT